MSELALPSNVAVLDRAELCVIGGGLAGVTAALTASKSSIDTVIVEERGALGWEISHALEIYLSGGELTPTFADLLQQLKAKNAASDSVLDTTALEVMLDAILVAAGVRVHFRVFCGAADPVAGVARLSTKSGPCVVTAKAFIDATETSRVARNLGAKFSPAPSTGGATAMRSFLLASVEPPVAPITVAVEGAEEVVVSPTLWPHEAHVSVSYKAAADEGKAESASRFLVAKVIETLREHEGFEQANLSFSAHEFLPLRVDRLDAGSLPEQLTVAGPSVIGRKPTLEERAALGETAAALAIQRLAVNVAKA